MSQPQYTISNAKLYHNKLNSYKYDRVVKTNKNWRKIKQKRTIKSFPISLSKIWRKKFKKSKKDQRL
jgi:hypothetical protein